MRKLKKCELDVLEAMVLSSDCDTENMIKKFPFISVKEMDDGEMGSLLFISDIEEERRVLGKKVAEAEFEDVDGVTVSLCLNLDSKGNLFELDIWKVDFSKLKTWPSISQLRIS